MTDLGSYRQGMTIHNRFVRLGLTTLTAAVTLAACASGPAKVPSAAATPDAGLVGAWIVFQGDEDGGNGIFLMRPDGSERTRILSDVAGDLTHPDWSPDGEQIAFTVDRQTGGNAIMRSNADGSHPVEVMACDVYCDYAAWSPDATRLVVTRYLPGDGPPPGSDLVVVDLATGEQSVVASSAPGQVLDVARWSPDGSLLVFGIDRFGQDGAETGSAIATLDLATGQMERLTSWQKFAYYPDWSPTKDMLVYSVETLQYAARPRSAARDLWLVRPDGSKARRLTHVAESVMIWQPTFAPAGDAVLATRDDYSGRVGVRIDLATGVVTQVGQGVVTHQRLRP